MPSTCCKSWCGGWSLGGLVWPLPHSRPYAALLPCALGAPGPAGLQRSSCGWPASSDGSALRPPSWRRTHGCGMRIGLPWPGCMGAWRWQSQMVGTHGSPPGARWSPSKLVWLSRWPRVWHAWSAMACIKWRRTAPNWERRLLLLRCWPRPPPCLSARVRANFGRTRLPPYAVSLPSAARRMAAVLPSEPMDFSASTAGM